MKNPDVLFGKSSSIHVPNLPLLYGFFYQTCSFVYLSKTQLQGDLRIGISFLLPSFFNGANDVSSGEGYPNHSTNRKKKMEGFGGF